MKNRRFHLGIISLMLCCAIFLTDCRRYYYHNYAKKLLDKYGYIESIEEIIGWGGNSGELPSPFAFDIEMTNNRRLFLSYVEFNKRTKSDYYPSYIELIGNYVIYGRIPLELISEKTGLNLITVENVITEYDTIYGFINRMTKLSEINGQLSENNKYHVTEYGKGYVGDEYLKKVKSFVYNNDDICYPLLVEMDKYPACYKISNINEKIPWEKRIVYTRESIIFSE